MTNDELERRVVELERELEKIKEEARQREIQNLKYGVSALGAVVIAMGMWIWGQVDHLFSLKVGK